LTLDLRHAFTLIELLVVIAVIGTLAALILPVVGRGEKTPVHLQRPGGNGAARDGH